MNKSNLGRKGLISPYSLETHQERSLLHGRVLFTTACFLRITSPGMAPSTMGWALPALMEAFSQLRLCKCNFYSPDVIVVSVAYCLHLLT